VFKTAPLGTSTCKAERQFPKHAGRMNNNSTPSLNLLEQGSRTFLGLRPFYLGYTIVPRTQRQTQDLSRSLPQWLTPAYASIDLSSLFRCGSFSAPKPTPKRSLHMLDRNGGDSHVVSYAIGNAHDGAGFVRYNTHYNICAFASACGPYRFDIY
jgi:hypothetical protein